ncbi:MAG UNVERIFIED_CONTAM: hypothetical protein LVT10_03720 [Anaerolineae bacterium]|jgi:predicted  nucleic acid-binding Zn-ribbon protein
MPDIHVLYELQQIDQRIQQLRARLDEVQKLLDNDTEIKTLQGKVDAQTAQTALLKKRLRALEADLEALQEKVTEVESILYGGVINHAKVLKDRQTELSNLQKRLAETEEKLWQGMMALEEADAEQRAIATQFDQLIEHKKREHEHLFAEQRQAHAKIAQLQAERLPLSQQLQPATLKLYETLRSRFKGAIVVKLQAPSTCGFCGVEQSRIVENEVRRGIGINQCSNCQRILMG